MSSPSRSFTLVSTVEASTKRNPTVASGKRGTATTNISLLECTPLDPVSAEVANRFGLNTPHEVMETFVDADLDILAGDILVVNSSEYQIKATAEWDWRHASSESQMLHLILEELKD